MVLGGWSHLPTDAMDASVGNLLSCISILRGVNAFLALPFLPHCSAVLFSSESTIAAATTTSATATATTTTSKIAAIAIDTITTIVANILHFIIDLVLILFIIICRLSLCFRRFY